MAKKSMPWLRLYTEFSADYKVQMLSESMQRRLIMLFCFQRDGTLNSMSDEEICYRLSISKNEWKKTRLKFYEAGFINDDDEIKNGHDLLRNFSNRQRDSDNSTERKRNQRLRAGSLNNVTGQSCDMSRECPVVDTDTDTDTELKDKEFTDVNSMSGKPDIAPLSEKKINQNLQAKNQALEILDFLNEVTGKKFRPSETNLKFIISRLKSGVTAGQCRQVIAKKRREWIGDEHMAAYLRPATLFNATKFEQYLGELG